MSDSFGCKIGENVTRQNWTDICRKYFTVPVDKSGFFIYIYSYTQNKMKTYVCVETGSFLPYPFSATLPFLIWILRYFIYDFPSFFIYIIYRTRYYSVTFTLFSEIVFIYLFFSSTKRIAFATQKHNLRRYTRTISFLDDWSVTRDFLFSLLIVVYVKVNIGYSSVEGNQNNRKRVTGANDLHLT